MMTKFLILGDLFNDVQSHILVYYIVMLLNRIVHLKIKKSSLVSHSNVDPNLTFSFVEHKRQYLKKHYSVFCMHNESQWGPMLFCALCGQFFFDKDNCFYTTVQKKKVSIK